MEILKIIYKYKYFFSILIMSENISNPNNDNYLNQIITSDNRNIISLQSGNNPENLQNSKLYYFYLNYLFYLIGMGKDKFMDLSKTNAKLERENEYLKAELRLMSLILEVKEKMINEKDDTIREMIKRYEELLTTNISESRKKEETLNSIIDHQYIEILLLIERLKDFMGNPPDN